MYFHYLPTKTTQNRFDWQVTTGNHSVIIFPEGTNVKYCVIIMDGAAGRPLPEYNGLTCLERAETPNLDFLARNGIVGMTRTIPPGMEPSSSNGCMSVLGYDPDTYRVGRAAIEALSLGIPVEEGDILFRCNLVSIKKGIMHDYSAGHIPTPEAKAMIRTLNEKLGSETVTFYPGLNYRHILKVKGREDLLEAECTPPHDISGRSAEENRPKGRGSEFLDELMRKSEEVLRDHPINRARRIVGDVTADTIWLFWGSARGPHMPSFQENYGLKASVTSAVDVIRGLAGMLGIDVLEIPGVTDGMDNDFSGQMKGALESLRRYDLAVVHIEAPDEEGHSGSAAKKTEAIRRIDGDVISQVIPIGKDNIRVLVMPDHRTPVELKTHSDEPVPFLLWGEGFSPNGGARFTESAGEKTRLYLEQAHTIMKRLTGKGQ